MIMVSWVGYSLSLAFLRQWAIQTLRKSLRKFKSALSPKLSRMTGLIVSVYYLGCFLGCIGAAMVGFKLGRKRTIHIGSFFVVVGAAIQAASFSNAQIIVGRIIAGIGTGLSTSTIPTWVSETSAAGERGALIAFQLAIVSFGILIAYWLDYGMAQNQTGQVVWRFPVAFQAVFAFGTMAMLCFLPERFGLPDFCSILSIS